MPPPPEVQRATQIAAKLKEEKELKEKVLTVFYPLLHPGADRLDIFQQIREWYGNHTGSRAKDAVQATKDTRAVITSLILGGKVKRPRAKQAIYVYQDKFRERLTPLLDAAWEEEKAAKGYKDDKNRLSFRNDLLTKMLSQESEAVRAEINEMAKASGNEKKTTMKVEEEAAFLTEDEASLPEEEKARIMVGKKRQKYEPLFPYRPPELTSRDRGIDRAAAVLTEVSRAIQAETGLIVQCIAAGPEPGNGGKMAFIR